MGPFVPKVKGTSDQKLANGGLANGEHANKIEKYIESNSDHERKCDRLLPWCYWMFKGSKA